VIVGVVTKQAKGEPRVCGFKAKKIGIVASLELCCAASFTRMNDMNEMTAKRSQPVVLVVEDDYLIRMSAAQTVADAGFGVVEAGNADEAIAILEARTDVRVMFSDIDMPGSMDGLKLAKAVRGRWPPIEVILTSGKYHPEEDGLPARGHFIPKPYRPDTLVDAVRRMAA
jgi:two-component system, response regulator PdtaR